jgi:hypothetical protein
MIQPADAQKKKSKYKKKTIRKTTVAPAKNTDSLNQSMLLCYTMYGMPSWYLAVNKDFRFPVDMQQPAQYRLTTTNDTLLTQYLKSIPYDTFAKKIVLPLYSNLNLSCREFMIQRTVTMDAALQAKYPELMSFKAVDAANPLNIARIDCDGKSTRIMMNLNGDVYYATPFVFNKKTYYACYSQNDPNFVKQKFE